MSYLLSLGKKVQREIAPPKSVTVVEVAQPIALPVYKEPEPEPEPTPDVVQPITVPTYTEREPEMRDDYGASPLTDELIQESPEEQCASLPVPASTTSSHTEESSE